VEARVYVDGRISTPADARISVLDHGFLFGDSVYEVIWWHRGAPIQERDHLDRLAESARRTYLDLQASREDLAEIVRTTVAATGATAEEDVYVRLVVTRGVGPLGIDFARVPKRSIVVIAAPAERPSPEALERGLRLAVVERRRTPSEALDPGAKTGNYLNSVLALAEAKRLGADDAVMLNEHGEVTEATTSNVYVVRHGAAVTPPLTAGILRGTTRTRILDLCARNGIRAVERTLRRDDLRGAREIFLSSSVRGVVGATSLDGAPVGDGRPGPVTRRIHELFEAAADEEAAAQRAPAAP
jgi:branched-chain amino acid aminotransferase